MIFNWSTICVDFLSMAFFLALYPVFNRFFVFFNCVSWFFLVTDLAWRAVKYHCFFLCHWKSVSILFYVVLALVRPIIKCFFMLSILHSICCQCYLDFRGQYSVGTVSVIIQVIGRNLKSIHFSRSEQYNRCLLSTSIWFILQHSANIFVLIVFYVFFFFVGPIAFLPVVKSACRLLFLYSLLLTDRYQENIF